MTIKRMKFDDQYDEAALLLSYPWRKNDGNGDSTSDSELVVDQLKERIEVLETKIDSFLSFGMDPFMSIKQQRGACQQRSKLIEHCIEQKYHSEAHCKSNLDLPVCLDKFPFHKKEEANQQDNDNGDEEEECIVYDFGIRKQPLFGEVLSFEPFNCKVYAFDPSPITKNWYENKSPDGDVKRLQNNPNYMLYPYGAGGEDEKISLNEYNWDQVTIYRYPSKVVDPTKCDNRTGACKYHKFGAQKRFKLPVRSLPSIMEEFNHTHITILKLDIEGSEYRFLETIINNKHICRNIQQITMEWHHMDYDVRYGVASIPHLNTFISLLEKQCGLVQYWVYDKDDGGWPSNTKIYHDMHITLRYQLASFVRAKRWDME